MLSTEDTKSYFDRACKTLFVSEPPLRSISLHMGSYNHILTVKFIIVILYNQSQESCFYYSVFNNSYWYLVFRMPMFVDTELSCNILFRGRAFALIYIGKGQISRDVLPANENNETIVLCNIRV